MAAPILIQYAENSWSTTGAQNVTGLSWNTGDLIAVIGGNQLGSTVIAAPTNANLTFTPGTPVGADSSHCYANSWTATAGSTQTSQTIAGTGSGTNHWGFAVWVFRGSAGIGNVATDATSALTVSLTRSGANSLAAGGFFDFNTFGTTGYSFTPTVANDRDHAIAASSYTVYVADWGDQGAPGTTSYGIAGVSGSPLLSKVVLEIRGGQATSGPDYATSAADLGDGSGSWANPSNATGVADTTYAVWTAL